MKQTKREIKEMNNMIIKALKRAMMVTRFIPKAPLIVVDDLASFERMKDNWEELPTILFCDTETIGLDAYLTYVTKGNIKINHAITVLQYFDGLNNYVVNIPKLYQQGIDKEFFDYIRPIHESKSIQIVFFNATFDLKMLWVAGIFTENAVCLMLGAKMCGELGARFNPSLKGISSEWLSYEMNKEVRLTFLTNDVRLGILTDEQLEYAGDDVEILAPIYYRVVKHLKETGQADGWATTNFSLQGTAFCELGGVPVDYNELQDLIKLDDIEYEALIAKKLTLGLMAYNLNSSLQVKTLYKDLLGVELVNTTKDTLKYYAETSELKGIKHEIAEYVYIMRTHNNKAREKLDKTFLAPMENNKYVPRNYDYAYSDIGYLSNKSNRRALSNQFGKLPTKTTQKALRKSLLLAGINPDVHQFIDVKYPAMKHDDNLYLWRTNLNTDGAVTGRYSSSGGPRLANLQNISGSLRAATRVPKGFVVCGADYTAIEILIVAQLANETGIIKAINEGLDVHKYSASITFGIEYAEVTPKQRKTVKAIVFLVLYGGTVYSLAESLGVDMERASEVYAKYFDTFPKFKEFVNNRVVEARCTGNVRVTSGAYRKLSVTSKSFASSLRKSIQRESKNSAMQGACAVIIKHAIGLMAREVHKRGWINKVIGLIPVHDELGLMAPNELADEAKQLVAKVMDEASHHALPDINKPVKVDVARHWSKESYSETMIAYSTNDINLNDAEEIVTMCFGTHTIEYKYWDAHKEDKKGITEFFRSYRTEKYENGTIQKQLQSKLI